MNNKMKAVSGIMIAAVATLTVNLIGSKDVHANVGGGFDRGGDMFASGGTMYLGGTVSEMGVVADFNQDGFDDFVAYYSDGQRWVSLYEEGNYVKTWVMPDVNESCWNALDVNGDGYPDLIAGCNWSDTPGGVTDSPVYINQLGPGGPGLACNTDLNDDGTVNIADLLVLIADWGDCL